MKKTTQRRLFLWFALKQVFTFYGNRLLIILANGHAQSNSTIHGEIYDISLALRLSPCLQFEYDTLIKQSTRDQHCQNSIMRKLNAVDGLVLSEGEKNVKK